MWGLALCWGISIVLDLVLKPIMNKKGEYNVSEKIVENEEVNLWISELNKSFKNRSLANIPYKEVKSKDIVIDNTVILGIYNDANKLLGGISFILHRI